MDALLPNVGDCARWLAGRGFARRVRTAIAVDTEDVTIRNDAVRRLFATLDAGMWTSTASAATTATATTVSAANQCLAIGSDARCRLGAAFGFGRGLLRGRNFGNVRLQNLIDRMARAAATATTATSRLLLAVLSWS
jgi:hypothetical protein